MEKYYQTSDALTLTIYVNGQLRNADLSGPTHLVYITVTRLSDNTVVVNNANATNVGVGQYEFVLSTANLSTLGRFKFAWTYTIDGTANSRTGSFEVVVPYTTAAEFRNEFSHLASKTNDEIYRKEALARKIIDTFCQQSFQFESSTTKVIRGEWVDALYLPSRIYSLTSVKIDNTDDITSEVEIFDDYWIRPIVTGVPGALIDIKRGIVEPGRYFRRGVNYYIVGDWGWEWVPEEIQHAARLLMADYFDDDNMLRQHGVIMSQMGDRSLTFKDDLWATTGNYDVDVLLSNYVDLRIRFI